MSDSPRNLSDVDPIVDGTTQSEIVADRIARDELITRSARRGNWICAEADRMAVLARSMGCYGGSPWDENLEDDEL